LKPKAIIHMKLKNLLTDKRSGIIKKWRKAVVTTYPDDTQKFFKREKDPFANPVGHAIDKDIETLFDELVKGGSEEAASSSLDSIIRMRAVQDFKPSQAVAFVLRLKDIIKEELEGESPRNGLAGELRAFDTRIDNMALLAFDIYSQCRQKIYELRVNEVRNHVGRLLERANLTIEIPEETPDS